MAMSANKVQLGKGFPLEKRIEDQATMLLFCWLADNNI